MVKFEENIKEGASELNAHPAFKETLNYQQLKLLIDCIQNFKPGAGQHAEESVGQELVDGFWSWPADAVASKSDLVGFSIVKFIYNSAYPRIVELRRVKRSGSLLYECQSAPSSEATVRVLRFEAPMWFANTERLNERVNADMKAERLSGLVLDMSSVPWIDITGANLLKKLIARTKDCDVPTAFASPQPKVKAMLVVVCGVEDDRFYITIFEAQEALKQEVEDKILLETAKTEDAAEDPKAAAVADAEKTDPKTADEPADASCEGPQEVVIDVFPPTFSV